MLSHTTRLHVPSRTSPASNASLRHGIATRVKVVVRVGSSLRVLSSTTILLARARVISVDLRL